MKKALIVDDAAVLRIMLRGILERNGYIVVGEAANGVEALEQYRICNPDFVTMDITMPLMDGIEAVKELIKIDPDAKVIMVSSMRQEHFVIDAINAGAKGFVAKPLKEEEIVKQIKKVLS